MSPAWRVFLFLIVLFAFISNVGVGAQNGKVVVSSDLELLSLGDVNDGGHVTWTLSGDQAKILRQKVVWMFDSEATIPRGFPYHGQATGATGANLNNGVIDSPEGTEYLTLVDSSMESGPGGQGTPFRFVTITHVDRIERDLPAERSSDGLVGSTTNTSTNMEIRFIFNANSQSVERLFPEADQALAQSLHRLFSFDTGTESLDPASCGTSCYPFPFNPQVPGQNGWRRVGPPPTGNYT